MNTDFGRMAEVEFIQYKKEIYIIAYVFLTVISIILYCLNSEGIKGIFMLVDFPSDNHDSMKNGVLFTITFLVLYDTLKDKWKSIFKNEDPTVSLLEKLSYEVDIVQRLIFAYGLVNYENSRARLKFSVSINDIRTFKSAVIESGANKELVDLFIRLEQLLTNMYYFKELVNILGSLQVDLYLYVEEKR